MATFFSDTTVGTWSGYTMTGTLMGTVTRSGDTVTLSGMTLALRVPAGQAWGDDAWSFSVNGTSTSFHVYAAGDGYSLGSYSLNNASITVSSSQTSASVGWTSGDGATGSFSVSFLGGGYVNGLTTYWDAINNEIRVSTTAAGVSSTGGATLSVLNWNVTESAYTAGIARRSIDITNGDPALLSDSLSTYAGSTINISPNKQLYTGLFASSSAGEYRYNGGAFVTVAAPATVSAGTIADTSVVINYSTPADNGYYNKVVEYSLDGTTWTTGATITGGSAASGTFTISGLSAGTTYNIQTRVTTTAGSTTGDTVQVTTTAPVTTANLYGSVNGNTKKVIKLYGPVLQTIPTGVTGTIRSGGVGNVTAFDGDTFWAQASPILNSKALDYLRVRCDGGSGTTSYRVDAYFTDGTAYQSVVGWDTSSVIADYGITVLSSGAEGSDYIDLTVVTSQVQATKRIAKLYGSVNGSAKLVYEDV